MGKEILYIQNSASFKFTKKSLQEAVNKFKGIETIPPMYSGLKVNELNSINLPDREYLLKENRV